MSSFPRTRSLLDQRAIRFAHRPKHVVAGERVLHLLQVPRVLRLARAAHLDQIHIVHEAAIVPDVAVANDGVADRQLSHLCRDLGRLERIRGRDRAQIVTGRGIDPGLAHGRHGLVALEKLLAEGAARVVVVPGEAGDVGQPLGNVQAHALHVGQERRRRDEADPRFLQAELVGGLQRVHDVVAAARHHHAPRLGGLRSQNERAEILHADRVLDRTDRLAARLLDSLAEIRLERVAEGVVGGDEEPRVDVLLRKRLHQPVGVGIGVPHPVKRGGRTALAGESERACRAGDVDLSERARNLLHRERGAGIRHVDDELNPFGIVPAPRHRRRDVRFVLMVAADRLDGLAEHAAAELLDRHSGGGERARPALVREIPGHVVEHADGDGLRL